MRLKNCRLIVLVLILLMFVACSKTAVYRPDDQRIRPLKTGAPIIRLHEDFLYAEREAQSLKKEVIASIKQVMSQQDRFRFEFIPSGKEVPRNSTNASNVFLVGDIWFHQGRTSGTQIEKVTRTENGFGYTRSWEELERRQWDKRILQTAISLYFIEIGSETDLLRANITVSADERYQLKQGGRIVTRRQDSQFLKEKDLQPGYRLIRLDTNLEDLENALKELANKAVTVHFDNL